jgi:Fe2+ or Zn2+ uptake regulation protein
LPRIVPQQAEIKTIYHNPEQNGATMSYSRAPRAVCDACGSTELVPARDELAVDPTAEHDDLLTCLACGRIVETAADR